MKIPTKTYEYRERMSSILNANFSEYFISSIEDPLADGVREKLSYLRINAAGLISFDDCHHPIISNSTSHDNDRRLARAILNLK